MKGLISTHKDALEKYTDLDLPTIEKVTYLHDFDREVQYVTPDPAIATSDADNVQMPDLGISH